jgi:hypothetical protein
MSVRYEDQWLRISCTECDGLFGDKSPQGSVFFSSYPAAGLTDRSPDDALMTGFYRCMLDITYMMRDVCRECAGSFSASVTVCDAHQTLEGKPCSHCGTRFRSGWNSVVTPADSQSACRSSRLSWVLLP